MRIFVSCYLNHLGTRYLSDHRYISSQSCIDEESLATQTFNAVTILRLVLV